MQKMEILSLCEFIEIEKFSYLVCTIYKLN